MSAEVLRSSELCDLVNKVEQLLEARVVCFVYTLRGDVMTFGFPGSLSDTDLWSLLVAVGAASQDALKSL